MSLKGFLNMENTLENKAKFFAQYWEQRLVNWKGNKTGLQRISLGRLENSDYWLELKPLSSITDEDAIEIDRIFYDFVNHQGNAIIGKNLLFSSPDISRLPALVCDFLRSKGYAMQWMGLSVENQIEFGWIKLKS